MKNLDEIKNDNGFDVPEHYFDELGNNVIAKIKKQEKKQRNNRIFMSVSSIAASLLIILSIFYFKPTSEVHDLALVHQQAEIPVTFNEENLSKQEGIVVENIAEPVVREYAKTSSEKVTNAIAQNIQHENLDNIDYQIIEYYDDDIMFADTYLDY